VTHSGPRGRRRHYFLCRLAFGNVPIAATLKSVDLIKREIMPAFA
jgi:hypothetical protein